MDRIVALWITIVVGLVLSPQLPLWAVLPGLLFFRRLWPVGFALGWLIGHSIPWGPVLRGPSVVQGRVIAAPVGRQADLEVWACATGGGRFRPCRGRVRVRFQEPVGLGSSWVVQGTGREPRSPGLQGGPDPAFSARLARVRTVLYAQDAAPIGRHHTTQPKQGHAAVLAAIATGDRRGVDPDTWALLRDTGTAHLLAISGFHVGVVAGMVGGLVHLGLKLLAAVRHQGVSRAWAWWAGALAGLGYAWFAGAPISAQRAAGVGLLAAVGRSFDRRLEPLRLVGLVALFVCAVDPSAVVTPGFQLSFGAVVGLVRFGPVLDGFAQRLPRGLRWMGRGLVATTAATLGTLPAAAWWFQAVAPGSPLANLLAIPWFAVGVVPFAVGAQLPWVGGLFESIGSASLGLLFTLLQPLRFAPLAPAVDSVGAVLLCAVFVRVRVGWVVSVMLVVLGLRARPANGLEVRFFDVGQGDAALVDFPDGRRWLVDAGRSHRLLPHLRRLGVRRLDVLAVSHPDADHAAGALPIVCSLRVDQLWIAHPAGHEELLAEAARCDVPVVVRPSVHPGRNDGSLVLHATSPWGSVLFTGDIEAAAEAAGHPAATVLKVPHHGSSTSSTSRLLDAVRPALAVLSVGPNFYGHPHDQVLQRYASRGIPLVRTDGGTVTVRLDADGLSVGQAGLWTDLATNPNTAIAKTARTTLIPWL